MRTAWSGERAIQALAKWGPEAVGSLIKTLMEDPDAAVPSAGDPGSGADERRRGAGRSTGGPGGPGLRGSPSGVLRTHPAGEPMSRRWCSSAKSNQAKSKHRQDTGGTRQGWACAGKVGSRVHTGRLDKAVGGRREVANPHGESFSVVLPPLFGRRVCGCVGEVTGRSDVGSQGDYSS